MSSPGVGNIAGPSARAWDAQQRCRDAVSRQSMRRLVPYLALLYLCLFLDRQNINFAGLQMNQTLGLSATAFGMAVGLFSIGYLLFEVPSTLLLRRFGARTWLARIMVTWGLLSAATAFVNGAHSLYAARFLLGVAEAGFVPGVIYYLTHWLPTAQRGRIIGGFMLAVPLSTVLGAPLSGALLELHWLGLAGWQWLFLLEGLPAALLGLSVLRWLPNTPDEVTWLSPEEKSWLRTELALEHSKVAARGHTTIRAALSSPLVWLLGLICLGNGVGLFGLSAFLPLQMHGLGLSFTQTGIVIAFVYLLMAVSMLLWTRHADLTGEHIWHVALPSLAGVLCIVLGALNSNPIVAVIFFAAALVLMGPVTPAFWNLPPKCLSSAGAAAGIALINSVGALGAFIGPTLMGLLTDRHGSFSTGELYLSAGPSLAAALTLALLWHGSFRREADGAPAA